MATLRTHRSSGCHVAATLCGASARPPAAAQRRTHASGASRSTQSDASNPAPQSTPRAIFVPQIWVVTVCSRHVPWYAPHRNAAQVTYHESGQPHSVRPEGRGAARCESVPLAAASLPIAPVVIVFCEGRRHHRRTCGRWRLLATVGLCCGGRRLLCIGCRGGHVRLVIGANEGDGLVVQLGPCTARRDAW